MRGKRVFGEGRDRDAGLIPAHAGKTLQIQVVLHDAKAHPRACGENYVMQHQEALVPGSSPRMRGKPSFEFQPRRRHGLIPAHAGKTDFW